MTAPLRREVTRHATARASLTRALLAQIGKYLGGFAGWYDDRQTATLARSMVVVVEAAQRRQVSSTTAYLSRLLSEMTGTRVPPYPQTFPVGGLRRGVDHNDVYQRVAATYRFRYVELTRPAPAVPAAPDRPAVPRREPLPPGQAQAQARRAALVRARAQAEMDVALAERETTLRVLEDASSALNITGYRRVIHPELSTGGVCGLCVAASDRLYRRSEPMPLHESCRCTTVPVIGDEDPGSVMNAADLRRLYKAAGSTNRRDLVKVRYQVLDHGELGPVLRVAGQRARGPEDLPS